MAREMAASGDNHENPFFRGKLRKREHPNLNKQDIGNQARILMTDFIAHRIRQDGVTDVPAAENLIEPGTPTGPPVEKLHAVAMALRQIGDELDQDVNLHRLMGQLTPKSPRQLFVEVASALFADGNFNWGRVVALFYFAYKMILKALVSHVDGGMSLLRSIVEFIVEFIVEHVAQWIISRGGWNAIFEYFGATGLQYLGVFLSGALAAGLICLSHR